MKRIIIPSQAFGRAATRLAKRQARHAEAIEQALEMLEADAFNPRLRTHKLKGDLADRWSCSAAYDLRILFRFGKYQGAEAIELLTVGTHDEVY